MPINNIRYGLSNLHSLNTRKAELVWDGKYCELGNRREVDIVRYSMPMHKIQMIDELASHLS